MRSVVAMALVMAAATAANAQTSEPAGPVTPGEWQFSLAPYLWAVSIEGSVDADNVSTDVDVSFSDILDDLDVGALAAFEARRDKLSLTTNVVYLKLSTDGGQSVGPGIGPFPPGSLNTSTDAQALMVEQRVAWEVLSLPIFGAQDERRLALDVGPLARVWWLDTDTDVSLRPGFPGGPFTDSFDESFDWVDFCAAARLRTRVSEKLAFVVSGDYGGFDIGSSSHRTWSLAGFALYRLGEHWDLGAGWRFLNIDRKIADLDLSGPLIGASYRF